jgi:hypothetical protein
LVLPASNVALPSAAGSTVIAHRMRRVSFGRRPSRRRPSRFTNSIVRVTRRERRIGALNSVGGRTRLEGGGGRWFLFFPDQGDLRIGVVPKSVCGF